MAYAITNFQATAVVINWQFTSVSYADWCYKIMIWFIVRPQFPCKVPRPYFSAVKCTQCHTQKCICQKTKTKTLFKISQSKIALNQTLTLKLGVTLVLTATQVYDFVNLHWEISQPPYLSNSELRWQSVKRWYAVLSLCWCHGCIGIASNQIKL